MSARPPTTATGRRRSCRRRLILAGTVVLGLALGVVVEGQESAPEARAKITYLTGATVYIDAGSDDGLRPGDRVEVLRDGRVVAELTVDETSNHRATCKRGESETALVVGDVVRYTPHAAPGPAAAATPSSASGATALATTSRSGGSSLHSLGIRARVGVRFLAVANHDNDVADFNQPALDLLFLGDRIGGTGWSAAVDIRARRTTYTATDLTDKPDTTTGVYRLAFGYQTADGWAVTVGRQYSPSLANVSTFDGLAARIDRPKWSAGLFAGSQPDALDYGYSSDIREYGAFAEFRGSPTARYRWQVGTGAVGSYYQGEVNREFVFLQFRVSEKKLNAYGLQEVDVNRDWKQDAEGQSFTPTSTYLNLSYRLGRGFGLTGGYDNRRNVRLYLDRVTPVTEFDERHRQGVWLGAFASAGRYVRLDVEGRGNSGSAGDSRTYTGGIGFGPFTRQGIAINGRATRYENDLTEGWLLSSSLGLSLGRVLHLGVDLGTRDDNPVADPSVATSLTWYAAEVDLALDRHWFMLLSLERTTGDLEDVDQLYTTLSYQF